ncbi:hypothetical protein [Singulisphaera sp. PoT]|uniref:hypothetical protein n=1 Tax=Singulisphaera sp. PoT TaxID=3411797 RepID=UPI003BF59022
MREMTTWHRAMLSPLMIDTVDAIEHNDHILMIVTLDGEHFQHKFGERSSYFRTRVEAIKWLIDVLEVSVEFANAELEDCQRKLRKAKAWAEQAGVSE